MRRLRKDRDTHRYSICVLFRTRRLRCPLAHKSYRLRREHCVLKRVLISSNRGEGALWIEQGEKLRFFCPLLVFAWYPRAFVVLIINQKVKKMVQARRSLMWRLNLLRQVPGRGRILILDELTLVSEQWCVWGSAIARILKGSFVPQFRSFPSWFRRGPQVW